MFNGKNTYDLFTRVNLLNKAYVQRGDCVALIQQNSVHFSLTENTWDPSTRFSILYLVKTTKPK